MLRVRGIIPSCPNIPGSWSTVIQPQLYIYICMINNGIICIYIYNNTHIYIYIYIYMINWMYGKLQFHKFHKFHMSTPMAMTSVAGCRLKTCRDVRAPGLASLERAENTGASSARFGAAWSNAVLDSVLCKICDYTKNHTYNSFSILLVYTYMYRYVINI